MTASQQNDCAEINIILKIRVRTRRTHSRPSDIPVEKAKERKRNSEEQCAKSRQLARE